MTEELKQKAINQIRKLYSVDEDKSDDFISEYFDTEIELYIAGATEYGIQWHKVADKIPMNEGWVCNQNGLPCWYDLKNEQWLDCEGTTLMVTEWCDMPH